MPHETHIPLQNWTITKPSASGRHGMVVSQSRDASEAGVQVLEAGGNAADAAAAVGFALATSEPWNSGLGGIGFALFLGAGDKRAKLIDFGPLTPRRTDPRDYPLLEADGGNLFGWPGVGGDRNVHGPLSFCIPSAVAGYAALTEQFGSGLAPRHILDPAIRLAKRGLAQDWFSSVKLTAAAPILRQYPESARLYLKDGLPPPAVVGGPHFLGLGRLAETLERLAAAGFRDFYEGAVAESIVSDVAGIGGVLDDRDMAACRALVQDAPITPWREEYNIFSAGGLTAAPTFDKVVEGMRLLRPKGSKPSSEWFVELARVLREAYTDRLSSVGATQQLSDSTCTTHVSVVDRDGNMVSMTTTLLSLMGSGVVLPGSGVLMNNGIFWFDPNPNSANAIAPNARPLSNMCPVIAVAHGINGPRIAAGASGGRRILAAVYQTLSYLIDWEMTVEQAAHWPRIDVSGPDLVSADPRLGAEILAALSTQGPLSVVEHVPLPINYACPNFIRSDLSGVEGCSDLMTPWSAAIAARH